MISCRLYPTVASYHRWHDLRSHLAHLRTFGATAWYVLPSKRLSEFYSRARRAILLGYPAASKGYKRFHFALNPVVLARSVTFLESSAKPSTNSSPMLQTTNVPPQSPEVASSRPMLSVEHHHQSPSPMISSQAITLIPSDFGSSHDDALNPALSVNHPTHPMLSVDHPHHSDPSAIAPVVASVVAPSRRRSGRVNQTPVSTSILATRVSAPSSPRHSERRNPPLDLPPLQPGHSDHLLHDETSALLSPSLHSAYIRTTTPP